MRHFKKTFLTFSLALAGLTGPVAGTAEQKGDIDQLLVQGHFWFERGRLDLSEKAWRKVLLVEPDNAEAKAGLAEIAALDPARMDQQKIEKARALALAGRYKEALALYQEAFQGKSPTSFYAPEYYLTVGGTEEGWPTAHEKLGELFRTYPSNNKYKLALGKVKTYRESTRREGIEMLRALSNRGEFRDDAVAAWREALLWLEASDKEEHLFREYLERFPDDAEVRARLNRLNTKVLAPVAEGYEAMQAKRPKEAAAAFEVALKQDPNDAEALAGLGIVRLRQERFTEARRLLSRAVELDPAKRADLEKPLDDAEFWSIYKQAEVARRRGDLKTALVHTKRAEAMRPQQVEVLLLRARIEAVRERDETATEYYRKAMKLRPKDKRLTQEFANYRKGEAAEQAAAAAPPTESPSAQGEGVVTEQSATEADVYRLRAEAAATEDFRQAAALLEQARAMDPDNPWVVLDLARLYRAQKLEADAITMIDELLRARPDDATASHVKALFHGEAQAWAEGVRALERIPEGERTEEQVLLYQHLWGNLKNVQAREAIAREDYAKARTIASEIGFNQGSNPELMLIRAELLADLGDRQPALRTAHEARSAIGEADVDLAIRYATVLLKTGQRGDLRRALARIKQLNGSLTPQQFAQIERLELNLALQNADDLRQQGEYEAALAKNQEVMSKHGADPQVLLMQATIHKDAGKYPKALGLYQRVVQLQPRNAHAWSGAVGTAMAMQDFERARALADLGLSALPNDPQLLALRGHLHDMRGDHNAAARDLRRALELHRQRENPTALPYLEVGVTPAADAEADQQWLAKARERLAALDNRKIDEFAVGAAMRHRSGDEGLSRLDEKTMSLQYTHAVDHDTRWGVEVVPTRLDAQAIDGNTYATNQFGTLALNPGAYAGQSLPQEDEGVAASAFYEARNWGGDVGVTPRGFTQENLVGSVYWKDDTHDRHARVGIERRAVKESLLSYAGAVDPGTGLEWGGVTRSGLAMSFDKSLGSMGVYGDLGFFSLDGDHVERNREQMGQLGVYWALIDEPNSTLKLGANLRALSFKDNLRFHTLGHGGYFSPQRYIAFTLPIGYEGQVGRMRFALHADIGVQDYRESNSAVYPSDPALQAQLETLASTTPGVVTTYKGEEKTEFVYNLRARLEYLSGQQWATGGWLNAANTHDYREYAGGLYLRYFFEQPAADRIEPFGEQLSPFRAF